MAKKSPSPSIRIRMYRVGFGDCFLISFPTGRGAAHVLVDCGVHARGDVGTIRAAVGDIARETRGKLALIVATHAQQDHISGFASQAKAFSRFQVGQVWLPWTENPNDRVAAAIEERRAALLGMITRHFAARPAGPGVRDSLDAALAGMNGNSGALHVLKKGLSVRPKYVAAGDRFNDLAGIDGLSARILGPPPRKDREFLARMDTPADERFLRAAEGAEETLEPVNAVVAFDKRWQVKPEEINGYPYYKAIAGNEREKNLLAVAASDLEGVAFAMDRVVNDTSVVTLFSFRGKHMLFPGDASYANWRKWMDDEETRGLLGEVSFLKVPHHGSGNAIPASVLEGMPEKGFVAMVSTQNQPWAGIPTPRLMKALAARAYATVRSDSIPIKKAPRGPSLAKLPPGFARGKFCIDYFIPV